MKKAILITKLLILLLTAGLLGWVLYLNWSFFGASQHLTFNLPLVMEETQTEEYSTILYLFAFFLSGFLVAYYTTLKSRFTIKRTLKAQELTIGQLTEELETLKGRAGILPRPDTVPDPEKSLEGEEKAPEIES